MSRLRRILGWALAGGSLVLYGFTAFCYLRQPDRFAAFTVMPIWLWGVLGLAVASTAWLALRTRLPLVLAAAWVVTLLVGSDEARALGHFGRPELRPGPASPYREQPVLRVATLNCAGFQYGDPSRELAAWKPDIVLLQDVTPHQVRLISNRLFGGQGDSRSHLTNGIVSRWKITAEHRPPLQRNHFATIAHPRGELQIANVHLASATTDLRLWKRSCWQRHHLNRSRRKQELAQVLAALRHQHSPAVATLLGGDFNTPASDVSLRPLEGGFTDAFDAAGKGWGDTFHRRLPILRIDHLYATRALVPVRCRVAVTPHSDHRFVIADFLVQS